MTKFLRLEGRCWFSWCFKRSREHRSHFKTLGISEQNKGNNIKPQCRPSSAHHLARRPLAVAEMALRADPQLTAADLLGEGLSSPALGNELMIDSVSQGLLGEQSHLAVLGSARQTPCLSGPQFSVP